MTQIFKVWCKKINTMAGTENWFLLGQSGIIYDYSSPCNKGLKSIPPNEVEILFFIGREDKNGTKIFNGDLLKHSQSEDAYYEVFYHDDEARYKCDRVHYHGNKCGGYVPDITSKNLEVVGNKFENPEMLKQS